MCKPCRWSRTVVIAWTGCAESAAHAQIEYGTCCRHPVYSRPRSGRPLTPIRPVQSDRPNPILPGTRAPGISAWVKASKMQRCWCTGMPMPESMISKAECRGCRCASNCHYPHDYFTMLGTGDRILDKVVQYLPQPSRISTQLIRHIGFDSSDELESFLLCTYRQWLESGIEHIV